MELANRIADAITDLTGQIWDHGARPRLADWLDEPANREMANRWLTYLTERNDAEVDPFEEFRLRRALQDVLHASTPTAGGFIRKANRMFPWRWKASRSPDPGA